MEVLLVFGFVAFIGYLMFSKPDKNSKCYRTGERWGEKGGRFIKGKPQLIEIRDEKDKRNKG